MAQAAVKPLKDMSERELRDMGNKALEQMRALYQDKRDGKEITEDREKQVDMWISETDQVEKELELRRKAEAFMRSGPRGTEIEGTDIDTTEEKFDPKFEPSKREVNKVLRKVESRKKNQSIELNKQEKKIYNLVQIEEDAFCDFFRNGLNPERLTDEQRQIFKGVEKRVTNQSLTTTAGGFLVPQGFIPIVIRYLKYISAFFDEFQVGPNGEMASTFTFRRTDTGNDLPEPTGDDTANVGELLGENSDASTSSAPLVFGQITYKAYKYSTKMIRSSVELLEDSAIDLPGYIAEMFGSRLGRIMNTHFTTGDNSGKPQGIVTGSTLGKLAGTTTVLSFPEIIDLIHSVDVSYRRMPTCRFMLHDLILAKVKKLTVGAATTNARPLWAPGWDVSAPPTIDGFQYLINNDMDSTVAAGKKVMLFGDMKGYGIRMVSQLRMLRLAERYAEFDQVAWVGFMRADGRTLNTAAIKYYAGT